MRNLSAFLDKDGYNSDSGDEIVPNSFYGHIRGNGLRQDRKDLSARTGIVSTTVPSASPFGIKKPRTSTPISKPMQIYLPDNSRESLRTPTQSMEPPTKTITVNDKKFEIDKNARYVLRPHQRLNDTIVEFYSNYLIENTVSDTRDKFHLFNTFFFQSLKKALKSSNSNEQTTPTYSIEEQIPESFKRAARRWDKNVRIFDKDFLIIPICDMEHWNLVIVCYANRVADQNINPAKRPVIILFESLGTRAAFSSISKPIRHFLTARWSHERQSAPMKDFSKEFIIKDICARVPVQKNSYDCGIYLLVALEKFLASPLALHSKICSDESLNYCFSIEPSAKRREIREVLSNLCDSSQDTDLKTD